jgi:RNA polymerase sigma-70 factor (ECF subfamily)
MPSFDTGTDRELLEATRAGEAEAFGQFFVRHRDAVVVYLRRRTGSAELALDLMAETFAAALLSVHRGKAEKVDNGAAWLLGIARHKLLDSYRAGRAEQAARDALGVERLVADDDDLRAVDELACGPSEVVAALNRLPSAEREAVMERVLNDRAYNELARDAGQSPTVMRKRVSRGLRRLRSTTRLEET